jgi:hypothetical protein
MGSGTIAPGRPISRVPRVLLRAAMFTSSQVAGLGGRRADNTGGCCFDHIHDGSSANHRDGRPDYAAKINC